MTNDNDRIRVPVWFDKCSPFIFGGLSGGLSTCIIQPIDMIKVRLQIYASVGQKPTFNTVFNNILKNDGINGFYKGLDAAVSRQLIYTTTRLGIYRISTDSICEKLNVNMLPFSYKFIIGLYSGGIGALVGNPADLSLIRLQSDSTLPQNQRRNYSGILNTVFRIVKEEGFFALYKGSTPTIFRAMTLNAGMLSTFDQGKEFFSKFTDSVTLSACLSSCISGFVAVTCSLPFDFIKTCLQKSKSQKPNSGETYTGFMDCLIKNYKEGGIRRFYTSYGTYYIRVAPHAMLTLLLLDLFNSLYRRYTIVDRFKT